MGLVPNPMQPDDIFDLILFPIDDAVVAGMGNIRAAILAESFSSDERSGGQAEILACAMQPLAFLACKTEHAVAIAHAVAELMRGETEAVTDHVRGHPVSFTLDGPVGEYGWTVVMRLDGRRALSFEYVGTELCDIDAEWEMFQQVALEIYPPRALDVPTASKDDMPQDPYADRRFRRIQTRAVLPDGRVRTSWHSYPLGVGKDVYDATDRALVRIYGTDNCRTMGTFFEDDGGVLKSDRTRRDGLMPVPCISCGTQLDCAANDPNFDHVPHAGMLFSSHGHYGSTIFDSFDGFKLQIVVCNDCLKAGVGSRIRMVDPKGTMTMWDGETCDYEPGSPEYEAKMQEQEARLRADGVVLTDLMGEPGF